MDGCAPMPSAAVPHSDGSARYKATTRAARARSETASRSCAATDAATNSALPGRGIRAFTSPRSARFCSCTVSMPSEKTAQKTRSRHEAGSLERTPALAV